MFGPVTSLLWTETRVKPSVGFDMLNSVVACPDSVLFETVREASGTPEEINVVLLVRESVARVLDSAITLVVS